MAQVSSPIECVECSRRPSYEDAAGWQAFLLRDPETRSEGEIVLYCPDCARLEFGPLASKAG